MDDFPHGVRMVDDVDAVRAGNEDEVVAGAADLEALDAPVLLEQHAEVGVRVLHDFEARGEADLDLAVPGVDAGDVLLEGELAHVLERVRAHRKYLACLSNQDDRVVVVEDAAQDRHIGLQGLRLQQLLLQVAFVEGAVRVAYEHLVALVRRRHARHMCGVELGVVLKVESYFESSLVL